MAWTKTGTTTVDPVEVVTTGVGHTLAQTVVAMLGTATATATARWTTVLTAIGHDTPCSMASAGGGDPAREAAGEGLAVFDSVATEVQEEEDMASLGWKSAPWGRRVGRRENGRPRPALSQAREPRRLEVRPQ